MWLELLAILGWFAFVYYSDICLKGSIQELDQCSDRVRDSYRYIDNQTLMCFVYTLHTAVCSLTQPLLFSVAASKTTNKCFVFNYNNLKSVYFCFTSNWQFVVVQRRFLIAVSLLYHVKCSDVCYLYFKNVSPGQCGYWLLLMDC